MAEPRAAEEVLIERSGDGARPWRARLPARGLSLYAESMQGAIAAAIVELIESGAPSSREVVRIDIRGAQRSRALRVEKDRSRASRANVG